MYLIGIVLVEFLQCKINLTDTRSLIPQVQNVLCSV